MAERKRSPRLYRRCPACGVVHPTVELRRPKGRRSWGEAQWSSCPSCEHEAPTQSFLRVDPPSEAEGGEG
jgi:hypothetical protein